jgi:hypothetical protein
MIILPDETLKLYNESKHHFEELLIKIKLDSETKKSIFLKEDFFSFNKYGDKNETANFINQFIPFLNHIIFFPKDNEVIAKLKKYEFSIGILKWMIDIEEIESEIRRLEKVDGLLIFPLLYLSNCINFVSSQFQIEVFENFCDNINHNNFITNKLYADYINRNRRRNYNNSRETKTFKSDFENTMNQYLDKLDNMSDVLGLDTNELNTYVAKSLKGNYEIMRDFIIFKNFGISKRKAYCEHFELFKMVFKHRKLKSEHEFYETKNGIEYNNNYNLYKISKVRDILKMK